mmetsp:Transcript_79691/g.221760  ORF Transcript_79691/g.221760 Transcript_79691/m.221760 type:complete len:201 (+) Transcript_79691:81-683(+)
MKRCFCLGAVCAWFLNTVSSSHRLFKERSPDAIRGLACMTASRRCRSSCFFCCSFLFSSSASRSFLIFASSLMSSSVSSSSSSSLSSSSSDAFSLGISSSASSGNGLSSNAARLSSKCFRMSFCLPLPSRSSLALCSLRSNSSRNSRLDTRSSGAPWLACLYLILSMDAASSFATFVVWATIKLPPGLEPLAMAAFHVGL